MPATVRTHIATSFIFEEIFQNCLLVMLDHFLAVHNKYDLFAFYDVSVLGELVKSAVKGSAPYVKSVGKIGHGDRHFYSLFTEGSEVEGKTALC